MHINGAVSAEEPIRYTRADLNSGWPGRNGFYCIELLFALPLGAMIFGVLYSDISKYRAEQRRLKEDAAAGTQSVSGNSDATVQ